MASVAKRRVDNVSPDEVRDGDTVAIIAVNELPPSESYIDTLNIWILLTNMSVWNHDRGYESHDEWVLGSHCLKQKEMNWWNKLPWETHHLYL